MHILTRRKQELKSPSLLHVTNQDLKSQKMNKRKIKRNIHTHDPKKKLRNVELFTQELTQAFINIRREKQVYDSQKNS